MDDQRTTMNTAVYAMKMLQKDMNGAAHESAMVTEEEVTQFVQEVRSEMEGQMLSELTKGVDS